MRNKIFTALLAVALVFVLVFACVRNREYRQDLKAKSEVIGALQMVIHEQWQQNPEAFDLFIRPTEAFQYADSVLESDWEDVFYMWNNN